MCLPDANLVEEDATEQGEHTIGQTVHFVQVSVLGGGETVGLFFQSGLDNSGVVEAVVATCKEEATKH